MAKECHPDRKGGSEIKMSKLQMHYGLLLAKLQEINEERDNSIDSKKPMLAIEAPPKKSIV